MGTSRSAGGTYVNPQVEDCAASQGNVSNRPKAAFPLSYSMTSSARARIDEGAMRPSALAVPRLTTSLKTVGCWTGKSAGFSPLRIFPT